jgi:hypothetical protein
MKPSKKYTDYLASKQWASKRASYWRLRGKKCQVCGSTDRLEVDHLDYTRLGHELMTDLLGLCHDHHLQVTEARRAARVRSGNGYRKVTEQLFGIKLPSEAKRPQEPRLKIPPAKRTMLPPARKGVKGPKKGSAEHKRQQAALRQKSLEPDAKGFVPKHLRGAVVDGSGRITVARPGWKRNADIPVVNK